MFTDLLVPTDGSEAAEAAIGRALDLARSFDAVVHTLSVVETDVDLAELSPEERERGRELAEDTAHESTIRVQERAADLHLDVVREVREGIPHQVVADYVRDADIDLVVMGSHGRAGPDRSRLGSTTERVVGLADAPVVVVPPADEVDLSGEGYGTYDDIVVPTDGSDVAARAGDHGIAVAERYGADLHVVYVVDTTSTDLQQVPRSIVGLLKTGGGRAIDAITERARDRNLPVSTATLRGVPNDAILQYAGGAGADLLVMGTRGRAASDDPFLGSTTARVLRRSEIPVMTVG